MKIKILTVSLFFISLLGNVNGQILNGSFEDTLVVPSILSGPSQFDTIPQYWWFGYPKIGADFTTDSYIGSRAVKLWSWYFGQSNGELVYGDKEVFFAKGHPISYKPDKLTGHYKFHNVNSFNGQIDSALVEIYLFKYNTLTSQRDTIGFGTSHLGAQLSYLPFETTVNYNSTLTPDSVLIYFRSTINQWINCNEDGAGNCNYLFIDNLNLPIPLGVESHLIKLSRVFPNPTSNSIQITTDIYDNYELTLYNSICKILSIYKFTNSLTIDLTNVSNGLYFINIKNSKGIHETKRIIKN